MKLHHIIQDNKKTIALFLSVGALSAIVNFCSFTIFWKLLNLNYKIAISMAYILSVIVHFLGNRNLTFKSYGSNISQQIGKYLLMVALNYSISLCTAHIVVETLHLSPYIGSLCAIGSTVCIGFLVSKFWVFKVSTI